MSGFRVDARQLLQGLEELETRSRAALGLYADTAARKLEAEAKRNKPWQNRTGNAVNSIKGSYEWRGNKLVIALSGNMNYSPILELCRERKYSVLYPTVRNLSPQIIRGMKRITER